jgi:hypothetical protein
MRLIVLLVLCSCCISGPVEFQDDMAEIRLETLPQKTDSCSHKPYIYPADSILPTACGEGASFDLYGFHKLILVMSRIENQASSVCNNQHIHGDEQAAAACRTETALNKIKYEYCKIQKLLDDQIKELIHANLDTILAYVDTV